MRPGWWVALAILLINLPRDIRRREIVFWPCLAALISGVLWRLVRREAAVLAGGLLPGVLLFLLSLITGGKIGAGDALVLAACGSFCGGMCAGGMLAGGFFLAGLTASVLLACGKRGRELPFVPFLLLSYLLQVWF